MPNRENDRSIMDLATKFYDKTSVLRSIQRVRMSLGLVNLSDICAANGLQMDKRFISKHIPKVVRNTCKWPVQHHVDNNDIRLWRKFLKEVFNSYNSTLQTPLGKWISTDYIKWGT